MNLTEVSMAEAAVWEDFYNERDTEATLKKLRELCPEAAHKVREEIEEIIFSDADSCLTESSLPLPDGSYPC